MPSPLLGVWIRVCIASEIVWVSPGIFDTKVMVAPNSPSAFAKASVAPAAMPGKLSGRMTQPTHCVLEESPAVIPPYMSGNRRLRDTNLLLQASPKFDGA